MWKPAFLFCVVLCSQFNFSGCMEEKKEKEEKNTLNEPDASKGLLISNSNRPPLGNLSRIVGGVSTSIKNYPFTAQLFHNKHFSCGASILTERYILTAAHCVCDPNSVVFNPKVLSVRAGSSKAGSGSKRHVSKISMHRKFDRRKNFDHDIAVVKLSKKLHLQKSVAIARIPPHKFKLPPNAAVTVVGWGSMGSGKLAKTLHKVTIPTVDIKICARRYKPTTEVTKRMICAGDINVGGSSLLREMMDKKGENIKLKNSNSKDACQGDSGGPLIYENFVVGIVSFGTGCGKAGYPGLYTNVASFRRWIDKRISKKSKKGRAEMMTSRAIAVQTRTMSLLVFIFFLLMHR